VVIFTPKTSPSGIFKGNVCSYLFQFPPGAGINDTLYFRINILKNAQAYFLIGNNYSTTGTNWTAGSPVIAQKY
jgi:hypothetical protein